MTGKGSEALRLICGSIALQGRYTQLDFLSYIIHKFLY